jgi:hypothetical protein
LVTVKPRLGVVHQAAERGATLTTRPLAFSRKQTLAPQPTDLNKLVAGMSELLRRTLGEQIVIETVLAGGLAGAERKLGARRRLGTPG